MRVRSRNPHTKLGGSDGANVIIGCVLPTALRSHPGGSEAVETGHRPIIMLHCSGVEGSRERVPKEQEQEGLRLSVNIVLLSCCTGYDIHLMRCSFLIAVCLWTDKRRLAVVQEDTLQPHGSIR